MWGFFQIKIVCTVVVLYLYKTPDGEQSYLVFPVYIEFSRTLSVKPLNLFLNAWSEYRTSAQSWLLHLYACGAVSKK